MTEYETLLEDGSLFIAQGEHRWQDAGLPGLSVCQCGLYQRYNRHTDTYTYTDKQETGR